MNRRALAVLATVALFAGAWWALTHRPPVVPAEQAAQEEISAAVASIEKAEEAVKRGRRIIQALPGEVKAIEEGAVAASLSADLNALADRANRRIREWVREHPAGDAVGSSGVGAGAVLAGGGGED